MSSPEPVARLDVRPMLLPERAAFLELLNDLDDAEWDAPTECPAWSVKGVALHILGDDLSLLARQRDEATQGLLLYAEHHPGLDFRGLLDGFNEQWVVAAQFLSRALIVELLRLTGDWTAELYAGTDPDALGEPVGFFAANGPSPYWQISAREYVERWVHHHQIRRAVDRPDLGPEFLVPALDAVVRGLAAHLPDLGASEGATIAVTIPGTGFWTLRRGPRAWLLGDGTSDRATAELTLKQPLATAAFSRALSRAEVRAAFAVSGDAILADRALGAIARLAGRQPNSTS